MTSVCFNVIRKMSACKIIYISSTILIEKFGFFRCFWQSVHKCFVTKSNFLSFDTFFERKKFKNVFFLTVKLALWVGISIIIASYPVLFSLNYFSSFCSMRLEMHTTERLNFHSTIYRYFSLWRKYIQALFLLHTNINNSRYIYFTNVKCITILLLGWIKCYFCFDRFFCVFQIDRLKRYDKILAFT